LTGMREFVYLQKQFDSGTNGTNLSMLQYAAVVAL